MKLLIDGVTELFEDPRRKAQGDHDKELIDQLYKQIGRLTVENDWLKKSWAAFLVTLEKY